MDIDRIAIYKPSLTGRGSSRTVLQIVRGFIDQNINLDLILAKATGELESEIPEEVRVFDFDVDMRYPITLTALPKMVEYLRSESPPVMLSNTGGANVVPLIANRLIDEDTYIIAKGGVESRKERIKKGDWRGLFMTNLVRWTYPWADEVVIAEREAAKKFLQTAPDINNKLHIVHPPVITEEILSRSRESVNHPWFNSNDVSVILAVQRLEEPKDTATIIRAFSRLHKRRDIRLVILGEGNKREDLESLITKLEIGDSVYMPGFVVNPYKYMRESDLFVLSSKKETFGKSLIEAMACGCPVVATSAPPGGVANILENGKWGELVPINSPDEMAVAMDNSVSNPVEGIEDRANSYSLNTTLNKIIKIIEDGVYD